MYKIMVKVIAVSLMLLGFSGCGAKVINVQKPCDMERPIRQTPKEAICAGIKNTKERELCTSKKHLMLEKDYDNQSNYIDACIR